MKRSEFRNYIKETIVEVLSEAEAQDLINQKELNKELEKTVQLSKELNADQIAEADPNDQKAQDDLNKALDDTKKKVDDLTKASQTSPLAEEDEEAIANPDDSVAKIADKLQTNAEKMLTVLDQWKKAEGKEKKELLDRLKALSKIKTDLEKLL
jgi:hypothetical protein